MNMKFTVHGDNAGKTVIINDRYKFTDGVLVCEESVGILIEPILCGYFGCTSETIKEKAAEKPVAETSLNKEKTKG